MRVVELELPVMTIVRLWVDDPDDMGYDWQIRKVERAPVQMPLSVWDLLEHLEGEHFDAIDDAASDAKDV